MNLSDIAFSSMQRSMASAYTQNQRVSGTRVASVTPVASVAQVRSSSTDTGTQLAGNLSTLLQHLSSGDKPAATLALSTFSRNLQAQTAGTDDGSGQGLAALLSRVSGTLVSGTTTQALSDIQNFLLNSGRATGTGFSATV